MKVAEALRQFILDISEWPIEQVHQNYVPEQSVAASGFVYFARRGTAPTRTFEQASGPPESSFFDIEIYHPDIDAAESAADLLHGLDCYHGDFVGGHIGAVFVETQADDYVPRVQFTDDTALHGAFVSIELRQFLPPVGV